MIILLDFLSVIISSLAFAVIFGIKGKNLFFSCLAGVVSHSAFIFAEYFVPQPETVAYLFAAAVMTLYCEIFARVNKTPVTVYLVTGLIPLVPGKLIYDTMLYFTTNNSELFFENLLRSFGIAAAVALGVVGVSTLFRIRKKV